VASLAFLFGLGGTPYIPCLKRESRQALLHTPSLSFPLEFYSYSTGGFILVSVLYVGEIKQIFREFDKIYG